ncbi:MAG: hypothetical protein WDW36_009848 [Sanguina aurantia]
MGSHLEAWSCLLDLLTSASGLKLRICLPSTALLGPEGRIVGWYHTDRDGVVCKASASEVSSAAVLHKLCAAHVQDLSSNPLSYVAVAHYGSGVCRLLRRDELQALLKTTAGPCEAHPQGAVDSDSPLCIQSYSPPRNDLRYIASWSVGASAAPELTVLVRRYSCRYTHALDGPDQHRRGSSQDGSSHSSAAAPSDPYGRSVLQHRLSAPPPLLPPTPPPYAHTHFTAAAPSDPYGRSVLQHRLSAPPPPSPPNPPPYAHTHFTAAAPSDPYGRSVLQHRLSSPPPSPPTPPPYAHTHFTAAAPSDPYGRSVLQHPLSAPSPPTSHTHFTAAAPRGLSANELLVESQLIAMGLLEPRGPHTQIPAADGSIDEQRQQQPARRHDGCMGGPLSPTERGTPAPQRVKREAATLLSALSSFVERAHGQRLVGVVAERNHAPSPRSLDGVAVPGQRRQSHCEGNEGGSAPASPSLNAQRSSLGIAEPRAHLDRVPSGPRNSDAHPPPSQSSEAHSTYGRQPPPHQQQQQQQQQPGQQHHTPNSTGSGSRPIPEHLWPHVSGAPNARPDPAPPATASPLRARPASASPTYVFSSSGGVRRVTGPAGAANLSASPHAERSWGRSPRGHTDGVNGHYTLREAVAATRPGSGGHPTSALVPRESHALWDSRETPTASSVSAQLARELEVCRERLQGRSDTAARAQAALAQLASTARRDSDDLRGSVARLTLQLERESEGRRGVEGENERLRTERALIQADRAALDAEASRLRAALAADRETLATSLRESQARLALLSSEVLSLRGESSRLSGQLSSTVQRLAEETEVVEAVRSQLLDYKQMVQQARANLDLQTQARRGKGVRATSAGVSQSGTPAPVPTLGSSAPCAAGTAAVSHRTNPRCPMDDMDEEGGGPHGRQSTAGNNNNNNNNINSSSNNNNNNSSSSSSLNPAQQRAHGGAGSKGRWAYGGAGNRGRGGHAWCFVG